MSAGPFTVGERARTQERIVAIARADARIVAGAAVGPAARGREDRWSDLDLTFGVALHASVSEVRDDFARAMERGFDAVPLFDVKRRSSVYCVFLLPKNLQVDLSFTPGHAARYGPNFRMLFGNRFERTETAKRGADEIFGYGAHHAVRARFSVERGRPWQAEYWVSGVRDEALTLACHRRGLEISYGRGLDRLPSRLLDSASATLVRSLRREDLLRALAGSVELLLQEAVEVALKADRLGPQLRALGSPDWT